MIYFVLFKQIFFVLMNEYFKFPALTELQGFLKNVARFLKITNKLEDVIH